MQWENAHVMDYDDGFAAIMVLWIKIFGTKMLAAWF